MKETETQKAIEAEAEEYAASLWNHAPTANGATDKEFKIAMSAYIAGRSKALEEKEKEISDLKKEVADLKRQLEKYETDRYGKDDFDGKRDPWDDLGKWANEHTF